MNLIQKSLIQKTVGETAPVITVLLKYPDTLIAILIFLLILELTLKRILFKIIGYHYKILYFVIIILLPRPEFTKSLNEITRLDVYVHIITCWILFAAMSVLLFGLVFGYFDNLGDDVK